MEFRFKIIDKYIVTDDGAILIIKDFKYGTVLQIPIDIDLYDVYEVGREFGQVEDFLDELF